MIYYYQKKAALWSRIIRSPESNIIYERVRNIYWDWWLNVRRCEDQNVLKLNNVHIDIDNKIYDNIHGVNINDISIENYMGNNPIMSDRWEYMDKGKDEEIYKPIYFTIFNDAFLAAKDLKTSDNVFMKNIKFDSIPKRISYYPELIKKPDNLIFHYLNDDNKQIAYSNDWCLDLVKENNLDLNRLQLIMTDGSVKDGIGGYGFFSSSFN